MKRSHPVSAPILRSALVLAALLLAAPGLAPRALGADPAFDPKTLTFPPLNPVRPVHPERYEMPNGIVVYLLEDHDLPVVTGTAYFRSSSAWEPAEKAGLAAATGEVMRSGGSAAHPGDWLDDRLGAIAASIGTSIDRSLSSGSFRCLSENTAEVVGLLGEILREPAFPEEKIELARVGLRRSIAERNDEMVPLLLRLTGEAVYGADSPYARKPEYATVEAIAREDCVRFHTLAFAPERMVLAVFGDFRTSEMKKLLAATFGSWKRSGAPPPEMPPVPPLGPSRVVFAPKEDVTQTGIVLTHLGFKASEPDFADMDVLETLLGGGFQSRLFNRIRTQRGLAYATGAGAGAGYIRPGILFAYSLTRSESTMVATDLLREEVSRVTREPAGDEELRVAKESVQNSFVFQFERPEDVLYRAAFYEVAGYPQDFLDRYQTRLSAVTSATVLDAGRKHIHPESMILVLVGKESDFDRPLESLGLPVERVDLTIPPPPSKMDTGEATPEAVEKGKAWLRRAADFAGGSAAWAKVRDVIAEQTGTVSMQGQSLQVGITSTWILPDRKLTVQKYPFGEVLQGFDGTTGWIKSPQGLDDQADAATQMKQEYERSLFHVLGHPEDLAIQALPEPRTVDGVTYDLAYVKSDLVPDWTLWFAPDGALARMEFQGRGPAGPAVQTFVNEDWRPEGDLVYPHRGKLLFGGTLFLEGTVVSVKFNTGVDPELFRKPAQ